MWTKSQAYGELEPLLVAGQLELLDHPELQRELRCLERRYHAGGRVSIDHPHGAHDDHANALALAVALALRSRSRVADFDEDDRPEGSVEQYERLGRAQDVEAELARLKHAVRARGLPEPTLEQYEAEVSP